MKKKLSLGKKVYGLLSVIILLLLGTSYLKINDLKEGQKELELTYLANSLSDSFIFSTGKYAIERGISNALFNSEKPSGKMYEKILVLRKSGDESYYAGIKLIEQIVEKNPGNKRVAKDYKGLLDIRVKFGLARENLDNWVQKGTNRMSTDQWLKIATGHIARHTTLRFSAFNNINSLGDSVVINFLVKQNIWTAAEFAGQIRAMLGGAIASKKPLSSDRIAVVYKKWSIVENNLNGIFMLKKSHGVDPRIINAIDNMRREFIIDFGKTRKKVFNDMLTGEYHISAGQWITDSTRGINSILGVAHAASLAPKEELTQKTKDTMNMLYIFYAALVAVAFFVVFMIRLFVRDVLHPLNSLISKLSNATFGIEDTSGKLSRSSQVLSGNTAQQAASLEQTAASLEELNAQVKNNVIQAETSQDMTLKMQNSTGDISLQMEKLTQAIDGIKENNENVSDLVKVIKEIGDRTKVIDDIVFQTKILSFNASVEAERAGEYGRGFAVVAQEVSNLAQMSGQAAGEISTMVKNSISKAEDVAGINKERVDISVKILTQATQDLSAIATNSDGVGRNVKQIVISSREQSLGLGEINGAISQIDRNTTDNAMLANENAHAGVHLDTLTSNLKDITGQLMLIVNGEILKGRSTYDSSSSITEPQANGVEYGQEAIANVAPPSTGTKTVYRAPSAASTGEHDDWEKL